MSSTTKDVAEKAKVSQATVSRVLNGYPYVNEKTRQKVLEVIKEMGYQPNHVARSMVLHQTNTLGLIVSDITNPFYGEIAKSIMDWAREANYNVVLCNNDNNRDMQDYYQNFLLQKRVDGIIFASVSMEDEEVEKLVRSNFPCIMCNRRLKSTDGSFVASNNGQGAFKAVSYLISLGHRRIGFISGPANFSTAAERLKGYLEALKAHGIEVDNSLIIQGRFHKQFAYEAAAKLLALENRPTAIFGANDLTALAAMECVLDHGLGIPKDMALVGYDDINISSHRRIGLTTVAQKKEEIGRLAVEKILEMIAKKKRDEILEPVHIYLEPQLIIRDTCGRHLKGEEME